MNRPMHLLLPSIAPGAESKQIIHIGTYIPRVVTTWSPVICDSVRILRGLARFTAQSGMPVVVHACKPRQLQSN
jgi:hypothetical protein